MNTIHLHDVTVAYPAKSHRDIANDDLLSAQLIIRDVIFLETMPVAKPPSKSCWELNFDCSIPSSPMTSSFSIAILRQPARRKQCNRLLGYVELREADIVGKIDKKERYSRKLVDVTQDGPSLSFSAGFSMSSSRLKYTFREIDAEKNNFCCMKSSVIMPLSERMYSDSEAQKDIPWLDLSAMYERVLMLPNPDTTKSHCLHWLGHLYSDLQKTTKENRLHQAADAYCDATRVVMNDQSKRSAYLFNAGFALLRRFESLGNPVDVNEAVVILKDAVRFLTDDTDNADKANCFSQLSNALTFRFEQQGNADDLDESIRFAQLAIQLTLDDDPDKIMLSNNLGGSFFRRFERRGDLNDLADSIRIYQRAMKRTPDGHPLKPTLSNSLAASLATRFKRLGNLSDLSQSIEMLRYAVGHTPDDDLDKAIWSTNLGNLLCRRFERLNSLSDLDESIRVLQDAIQRMRDDHADKCRQLANLGISFLRRFERLGDLSDINDSIQAFQDALKLTGDNHSEKASWSANLGTSLFRRFECLGNLSDINESVQTLQDAVRLTPHDHPQKPALLNNVGTSLFYRFQRLRNTADLNDCVVNRRQAVQITPGGHPQRPNRLINLGSSLLSRFEYLHDFNDIDESIQTLQAALPLMPDNHPGKPIGSMNLAISLRHRFERSGNKSDIDKSIQLLNDAERLLPDGHFLKASTLVNLGDALSRRYERLYVGKDANEALHSYSSAAQTNAAPASTRYTASSRWIHLAEYLGHASLFDAYSTTLSLLPQLAWPGSTIADRHHHIRESGAMTRRAAAAAIEKGDFRLAVEWLEQGRSVVWGQLLQLRTPLDDLKLKHPKIGARFEHLSFQLEGATIQSSSLESLSSTMSDSDTGSDFGQSLDYNKVAHEREKLIASIRRLPGFEQFLLPKSLSQLTQAAELGPVIILNASEKRCDAIVLRSSFPDDILSIPLPSMPVVVATILHKLTRHLLKGNIPTPEMLIDESRDVDLERLGIVFASPDGGRSHLETLNEAFQVIPHLLWYLVVHPIVETLGLTPVTSNTPRRIWWCPTGIFSFLPLHAAGDYSENAPSGSKLADYAVSSYTPSLTSLIQALESRNATPQTLRILAVAQTSSTGFSSLPGARRELDIIKKQTKDKDNIEVIDLIDKEGTVERVKEEMKKANWVHFACHGVQKVNRPTESALMLAGTSKLTLSEIITMRLPSKDLAFLSACQTATGDEDLSEEAVHLAAGMLSAGYRGVIATMWSISDWYAPRVADDVYGHLIQRERKATDGAEALYCAVKNLREKEKAPFRDWIPFIHVGL